MNLMTYKSWFHAQSLKNDKIFTMSEISKGLIYKQVLKSLRKIKDLNRKMSKLPKRKPRKLISIWRCLKSLEIQRNTYLNSCKVLCLWVWQNLESWVAASIGASWGNMGLHVWPVWRAVLLLLSWTVFSSNSYVKVLTSCASKCGCIWW